MSPRHLEFSLQDRTVWVRDLGTTHGSQLDGEDLPPRRLVCLKPGARLRVAGAYVFELVALDENASG